MISVNNIAKEFNGETLFSGVTFNINPKECIGLAGKNGSGKTTILRIINNELKADSGQVVKPANLEIGYLPQEKEIKSELSILDEVMLVHAHIEELKTRNKEITRIITDEHDYQSPQYKRLIEEQLINEEKIQLAEPEKMLGRAERILMGLGFVRSEFAKPMHTFSFGWQMRVEIAKLLLSDPFLLLLDEPTNHLDIESIEWLEHYLANYPGAVIIVSHDRTFLDNLTNRTIEINNGKLYDYKVPYSKYIVLREERLAHQKAAFSNQQKEIRQIERFIERFRYKNTKARQVQSRVKHLEKMDKIEIDELDNARIRFAFPAAPHSGKITVSGKSISKSYGDHNVLNKIDFQVIKGEKVAFVGRNGEGKSTLAKIIARQISHDGDLNIGYQVETGYYSQDQWEMLDPELTVFETLDHVAVGEIRKRLKSILGSFLFSGEDVDKKVKVLSGGEKARLSLAKLLLTPANLLILDEPTNHLDIVSKDILKNALLQYDGTLIIISHDRDFLEGLTTRLYTFKNQTINEFRGDIFEYLEKNKLSKLTELEKKKNDLSHQTAKVSSSKLAWEEKRKKDKKLRKLEKAIVASEEEIQSLEKEIEKLNEKMQNLSITDGADRSNDIFKEYEVLNAFLIKAYANWEELNAEKENATNET